MWEKKRLFCTFMGYMHEEMRFFDINLFKMLKVLSKL